MNGVVISVIIITLIVALIYALNNDTRDSYYLGDTNRPILYNGPHYSKRQYALPEPPLKVPVPQRALKETSERYGYPFRQFEQLSYTVDSTDYFKPHSYNTVGRHAGYADPRYSGRGRFYSSVNAYAPHNEVTSEWEKAGLLTTTNANDDTILVLYRRPIAPLQDLWEYAVQNKDGIIIPLEDKKFLENDDVIGTVPGLESKGSWKVKIYVNNKYVWM